MHDLNILQNLGVNIDVYNASLVAESFEVSIHYVKADARQKKLFIQQFIHNDLISPVKKLISAIETEVDSKLETKTKRKLSKAEIEERNNNIKILKSVISPYSGEYCTSESALGISFLNQSGILSLPPNQGGDHLIEIVKTLNK